MSDPKSSPPLPPPSPPTSPLPPPSPPSSPPSSPHVPVEKESRTWRVFATNRKGIRKPSRSTSFKWRRIEVEGQEYSVSPEHHGEAEDDLSSSESTPSLSPLQDYDEGQYEHVGEHKSLLDVDDEEHVEEHESNLAVTLINSSSSELSSEHSSMCSDYDSEDETMNENMEICDVESMSSENDSDICDVRSVSSEGSSIHSDAITDNIFQSSINDELVPSLYEGCEKNVDEAVLDVMLNHINNMETQNSLRDHLATFNKYLPQPNLMPKSPYMLIKYVKDLAPTFIESQHFYCSYCLASLSVDQNICPLCNCTKRNSFYSFSMEQQLRYYFEKCKIYEHFQTCENNSEDVIRDICDGSEYIRVHQEVNSSDEVNYAITLLLNTDGISLSHSSKTSLYPLQYIICELPPELRLRYMTVWGVWCDDVKPPMNIFLKPFIKTLEDLHVNGGFVWRHADSGLEFKCSVVAPLVCADAPVRAMLQSIKSHNSKYACNTCEQKTKRIPLTAAEVVQKNQGKMVRRKRAFLFRERPARLRTNDRMQNQAVTAQEMDCSVKGVKGPSILSLLPYVRLSTVVFGEYLHLVLLGVVCHFTNIWLTVQGPWYIGNRKEEIDQFMKSIAPPSFIGRLPRGVSEINNWKGSEFRAWLLYYSLPALFNILPKQYFQHWCLLVMSIFLLLQEEILSTEITLADVMLRQFVRDIGALYRPRDYVYNVHELLHLPLNVQRWGPLWATSAFIFESFNGTLAKLIHGTKNKGKELTNNLIIAHGVEILKIKVRTARGKENHIDTGSTHKLLNPYDVSHLTISEKTVLENHNISNPYELYSRLQPQGSKKEVFTSTHYVRERKRNNYTVCFHHEDEANHVRKRYGEVKGYLKVDDDYYSLINVFDIRHIDIFSYEASRCKVNHIIPVTKSTNIVLVPFGNILSKVIRVGDYVCICPNKVENHTL